MVLAAAVSASPALAVPPPGSGGVLSFAAGNGVAGPPTAGPAISSKLALPRAVAVDASGTYYIADTDNNQIEKVTAAGQLSIFAGTGVAATPVAGPAISSPLFAPSGLAVNGAGNVYIADSSNNRVEKVTPGGTLSVIAGTGVAAAPVPGLATASPLNYPVGVALDSSGNIYIGDTFSHQVLRIDAVTGILSAFAGTGTAGPATAGLATLSNLNGPRAVAVDSANNVYIADTDNFRIERVTPAGVLSFVAGTGTTGPPVAGPATTSPLSHADGVEVDGADFYIADSGSHRILKVTSGQLSFIAGTGTAGAATPGPALSSNLNVPVDVGVDTAHNVYIVDQNNNRVELVTAPSTPGAPTGLSATPGNGSATLSFTPGPDGGAPITGYEVSTDNGGTWATLTTSPGSGGTQTGTVTGLTNGTAYTVRVRADNNVGGGAPSASTTVTPAPVPLTPIQVKYASLGGPTSILGATVGPEMDVPNGRAQQYQGGWIYWSPGTGAHEVNGAIGAKYLELGDVTGVLGFPTSDETAAAGGGRASAFSIGTIYWSPATGSNEVHGLIGAHYTDLGGPASSLGYPLTDETTAPDGVGRFNRFGGGSIYWTPSIGAHAVYGAIRAKWAALGYELGFAGYPTSDETDTPGGGRVSGFQGAQIYWSSSTGTAEVHGQILNQYLALGSSGGIAGFPVTDETDAAGVPGARMNVFSATNLAIYWSAESGAHETYGAIRGYYEGSGGPAGRLGLPTSGEYSTPTGRASDFQYGVVNYNSATGVVSG
jgi:uncharacterized protein with LGFP repeats